MTYVGLTGGQIFHQLMLKHNVKVVFGYPGGAILPVYDAIYNSSYFKFILPRHEQGAGHMAQGYARASGNVGVCLVTSGPGATNMITPMQDALSDGTPMVVFSGQVPTSAIGTDAFQEADIIGISRAATKWNVLVKSINELPLKINQAFEIATSGRPGPVLVDLPKNVTASILNGPVDPNPAAPATHQQSSPDPNLMKIANMLNIAERPILYVGQGILATSDGPALLRELAHKANVPVTTTLLGMGAFDELDDKSLHMLGMHGSAYANLAMQTADCIVAVGARFDDRVTGNLSKFAPAAKRAALSNRGGVFQLDILPKNINKIVQADLSVSGDAATSISQLIPNINNVERKKWFDQLREWKTKYPFQFQPSKNGGVLKPQEVVQELDQQTAAIKDRVIISTGVGQHQMWAAQYFRWRYPRTFITSGGLGTMGFGLPAAIGAKVAFPDKIVVDIDGDASFSMTAMELMTARQFNIGVKVLILNNSFQGMVRQWQDLFYEKRYSGTEMKNPDFVKFAESMGCKGLRATTRQELKEQMKIFLETNEPVILDCVVDKNEHVYPMVPSGMGLHEMELGDLKLNEGHHKFTNSFMAP